MMRAGGRGASKRAIAVLALLSAGGAAAADVAVDVGHSLAEPGATSARGIAEFELNRSLARDVAERLGEWHATVRLIGAEGRSEVLAERSAAARGDRLLVSIHHDALPAAWRHRADAFHGFSLFVSRRNPYPEASLACARRIGAGLLAAGYLPSRYHAVPVAGENRPFADQGRGVHYFDDLVVLRTAMQPAVLVEAGVIVTAQEEAAITSAAGRRRLAATLAAGIAACAASLPPY